MLIKGLISNVALIIVLSFLYSLLYRRQYKIDTIMYKLIAGVMFGIIGIAGMANPLHFAPGIIFDGRSIVLSIAGLFGGSIVAAVSVIMTGIFRYQMGGGGTAMGLGVIVTSGLIGVLYRHLFKKPESRKLIYIYILGIVVHICMILWMLALPASSRFNVIQKLSGMVLLIYPIATVIVAKMLMDQETYIDSQKSLADSEKRYRIIFNQAAVGVAQIETGTGRFVHVNQRYCDILDMTKEELTSATFQDITHPDDLQDDLDNMEKLKAGEISMFSMEKRYIRRDRSTVWVNLTISPMWGPKEEKRYHIAVIEDISKRKQQEKEYRQLIDSMNDTAFVINFEGEFIEVNKTACQVLGYSREELLTMGPTDIDPHLSADDIRKLIDGMKSDEGQVFETKHKTKDGNIIPVEISSTPLTYQGEAAILSVARDISERKKTDQELYKYRDKLEELVRVRTAELEEKNKDLERYNQLFTGREFRIKELRDKIKELEKELGRHDL